jgi:hypothetical protein
MDASPPELRPRNALDLIDASVRLYRRHFGALLGISAVMLVPFGVTYTLGWFFYYTGIGPLATGQVPPNYEIDLPSLILGGSLMLVALVIVGVLGPLSQGALALAISEQYLGRTIGVAEAYRRVKTYWWSLFLVGIVFGLLVSFGPLLGGILGAAVGVPIGLYVVPAAGPAPAVVGVVLGMVAGVPLSALYFTWFVFYEQTMVLESARGMDSLQRSRGLVTGHGWHVFGTLFLTGLGTTIATWILSVPAMFGTTLAALSRPELLPQAQLVAQCVAQIVGVLLGPVFMIVQTLTYYDLRIRKEGFDLQMMAAAIEGLRRSPSVPEASPESADV